MHYEAVHWVWDYYDGPRRGIADFEGKPHYFSSIFDERADEYSANFELFPVNPEFMRYAAQSWAIFRVWEQKFHNGLVSVETHPGLIGGNAEYGDLQAWIDNALTDLRALPILYTANFRSKEGQELLPLGMLREVEVAWSPFF